MIPKTIHYCWFGGNPLPNSVHKCIDSWRKYCPDYEIIRWDESNFDVHCNSYCTIMYENKKWAFLSDFARLKIIFENGGIYLDTDVELLKPLNKLLNNKMYLGVETNGTPNTGLGFGAEKGTHFLEVNMRQYELQKFQNEVTCPVVTEEALREYGFKRNCKSIQHLGEVTVYPSIYFCPYDLETGIKRCSPKTFSIHHYTAQWMDEKRRGNMYERQYANRVMYYKKIPNRIFLKLLGNDKYEIVKTFIKGKEVNTTNKK